MQLPPLAEGSPKALASDFPASKQKKRRWVAPTSTSACTISHSSLVYCAVVSLAPLHDMLLVIDLIAR